MAYHASLVFVNALALIDLSSALFNGNLRASRASIGSTISSEVGSAAVSALDLGVGIGSTQQQTLGSMVSLQQLLLNGLQVSQRSSIKALLLKASQSKSAVGGIMYEHLTTGKFCNVNASYVYQGLIGSGDDCQKRCRQTVGCHYYTTYKSGWCQLSAVCTEQELARDKSAQTFAQVKRDLRFSQYSVGKRCKSDGAFLAQGMGMDCAHKCRSNKNCSYYTVYSNGYCELSASCYVEEAASTAVTYLAPGAIGPDSKVPKAGTKICKKSKLLPNLYVLGVQKSGTTALAGDLVEAGVWNTKIPEQFRNFLQSHDGKFVPVGAAAFSAMMNSAGNIAGNLIRTGILRFNDLSQQTKESIGFDLVNAGVLGTPTAQNLTDEANIFLAADLVKVGALDNLPISSLDGTTQTFLTRDLLRACLLNGTICEMQDTNARQHLEQEFLQASMNAGIFSSMSVNKLRQQTKHLIALNFMHVVNSKVEIADRISDLTMQSIMEDIYRERLALAEGMRSHQSTKDLADDFKEVGALDGDIESELGINTQASLADDLIVRGRLTIPCQGACAFLQLRTRQSLAMDINQQRERQGWSLIHANMLTGESLLKILKDFEPNYLTNMSKVFLVEDLLKVGLLFNGTRQISPKTRQLLEDDFKNAVTEDERLKDTTKASLARDAVRTGLVDSKIISHLGNRTKQLLANDFLSLVKFTGSADMGNQSLAVRIMQALDVQARSSLAWDLMNAGMTTLKVADHLSVSTKQFLTTTPSLAASAGHLRNYTLKFLGRDILGPRKFLDISSKVWNLQGITKQLITKNFLPTGIMQNSKITARFSKYTRGLIAHDIIAAGLQNYTKGYTSGFMDVTTKESHFFEHAFLEANYSKFMKTGTPLNWMAAQQEWEDAWLKKLLDCPTESSPVYADFTPSNMRMVPLPFGTRARGRHWGSLGEALFKINEKTGTTAVPSHLIVDLPRLISEIYGEHSKMPTFVVMLREPMARMQSAYYHSKNSPSGGPCMDCKGPTFVSAMNGTLQHAQPANKSVTPVYLDWMWASMYARQLEQWFHYFEPSQFYIIPTSVYTKGDKTQICKDVSARLRTDMDCSPFQKPVAASRNVHDHPNLEREAPMALRKQFDTVMDVENERLIKILAKAHKGGLGLATYEGEMGDEESIREWLVRNW